MKKKIIIILAIIIGLASVYYICAIYIPQNIKADYCFKEVNKFGFYGYTADSDEYICQHSNEPYYMNQKIYSKSFIDGHSTLRDVVIRIPFFITVFGCILIAYLLSLGIWLIIKYKKNKKLRYLIFGVILTFINVLFIIFIYLLATITVGSVPVY